VAAAAALLKAEGQQLPLQGMLQEIHHGLQNHLQLLQHGPHRQHSTTPQAKKDESTLPGS